MILKKETLFGVLGGVMAVLLIAGAVYLARPKATPTPSQGSVTVSPMAPTATPEISKPLTEYTNEDVAAHSTKDDCWLIIRGKVYDVTKFIDQHPGGAMAITFNCGRDATSAFETRGGKGPHPASANEKIKSLLIGQIK